MCQNTKTGERISGVDGRGERHAVTIVIPNYNGKGLLEEYLPYTFAAARHYSSDTEVIVVDDASTDDSVQFLEQAYPEMRITKLSKNVGFARACDAGIAAAKSNVIILLNTDVRVRKDFIRPLVDHFTDEAVFSVTCMSFTDDENTPGKFAKIPFFKRGQFKFLSSNDAELRQAIEQRRNGQIYSYFAVGGHCALDKSKYLVLGGFDDLFFPCYFEDVDLCCRAWKHGWKTIFEPDSVVYHAGNGSIPSLYRATYTANIIRRNRLLFVWKNITFRKYFYFHHLMPILIRSVFGFLVADVNFNRAFFSAVSRLPLAVRRRRDERKLGAKLSDEEILELTRSLLRKA